MAGDRIAKTDIDTIEAETRRQWVKPQVLDMMAGAAETGGDTNVDGDPGLS